MKGEIAASNAFGHSSWGKWPHPDTATNLCTYDGNKSIRNLNHVL